MAVIRSARLWASALGEGADATLFTCPNGYKAILRSCQAVMTPYPSTTAGPVVFFHLHASGVDAQWWLPVFMDFGVGGYEMAVEWRSWEGQLVLQAGDSISVTNNTQGGLHSVGSGALLPIQ